MHRPGAICGLLVVSSCTVIASPDRAGLREAPEVCDNGIDDNLDGLIDCRDPECAGAPACAEDSKERCTNGQDDDEDGLTDCADPNCAFVADCFLAARFERDPACPVRTNVLIRSDFRGSALSNELWETSGDEDARPSPREAGLDLASEANLRTEILSRDRFLVGSDYPLRVDLTLTQPAPIREHGASRLEVAFAEDAVAEPEISIAVTWEVLGDLAAEAERTRVSAACAFRRRPPGTGGYLRSQSGDAELRIRSLAGTIVLEAITATATREICRSPALAARSERPVGLRVTGFRASARDPTVALATLSAQVTSADPACAGLREPVLAPGGCAPEAWTADGVRLSADPNPIVLSEAGRTVVLAPGSGTLSGARVDRTFEFDSSDGRSGFGLAATFAPEALPRTLLGGASMNGRLRVWAATDATGTDVHEYDLGEGGWRDLGTVAVPVASSSFPGGVLASPEGHLTALFGAIGQSGESVLVLSESPDGRAWSAPNLLPIEAGRDADWGGDGLGASGVAITRIDDFVVIAYSGAAFGTGDSIGLAISTDGERFVPHPGNPVLTGADAGLDDGGVRPLALARVGDRLRLWYLGISSRPSARCATGAEDSHGGRLFVADLVASP